MLTMAAKEGGWNDVGLNHNMPLNNPFGINRIERGKAVGNVKYPSLEAAISDWKGQFGDRVRGAQTAADFVHGLQHPQTGQPYNTDDKKYAEKFNNISMAKWMKICGVEP